MTIRSMTVIVLSILVAIGIYLLYPLKLWQTGGLKEKRIVAVLRTSDTRDDYWQSVGSGAKAAAKEMDARLEVVGPLTATDTDAQFRLIETAIQDKPQAIMLAPQNDPRYSPLLEKIRKAGIRLVLMDTAVNGATSDCFIADNHVEDGRLAAQALTAETGAVYAAIIGDLDKSALSADREKGITSMLSTTAGSIVGTFDAQESEDRVYRIVQSLLAEHKELNGIIALNEVSVLGAAKALKEANRAGRIRLIGFDSSIYKVKLMEEGLLNAIVVQKPFNLGYLGVKAAAQLIDDKKTDARINIGSIVISKEKMYTPENQKLLFPMVGS